ncbi:MAG: acyl-CoA dehydrogenase family protein, partial [Myxococcales bacterium]|nr:acyl-CoA dehydrogenase family protein [Myxococcales bacterium]
MTHGIVVEELRRNSARVDATASWPEENLRALQAAGLGGLVVSTEAGGLGHGLYAVARVCELLGRECPSTAITFGMHLVASAVINAKATAAQRAEYLEPIARGEH